jgi:hypothetical protein
MDPCEVARRCAEIPVQADHETELHFGPVRQICFLPDTNEILSLGENDCAVIISTFPTLSRSSEHRPCPLSEKFHVRSFSLFPPDRILFACDNGRITSLRWPDWELREDIFEAEAPIHLICTDATGENFAFATPNEAFIRSNSWTPSLDSVFQTDQRDPPGILFLEFGPKCNTLVISTADAAVHAYNPALSESLQTLVPARSVPCVCVPHFNARSNLLLVDEGEGNKKLRIINFRKGRDVTLDLPERVVCVSVLAATTDRIALAQMSGAIVLCEFDWSHVRIERTVRGYSPMYPISQMTWAEQSLIAGDWLGKISVWTSLSDPVQLELQVPPPADESIMIQKNKRPSKLTSQTGRTKFRKASGSSHRADPIDDEPEEELSDEVLEVHPTDGSSTSGRFFIPPPEVIAPVLKKGVPLTDPEMETILIMHSQNKTWTEIGRSLDRPESTCREFWKHHK